MRDARPITGETGPDPLRLRGFGLHFAEAATEADFRRWYVIEAVPFSRLGMIASAAGWVSAWVGSGLGIPGTFVPMTPWILGLVFPLLTLGFVSTFRPGQSMLWISALANVVAGWVAVLLAFDQIDLVEASSLSLVVVAFFGFTIFRLHPAIAVPTVASYVILHQVLVLHSHSIGEIDARRVWVNSVMPWVAYFIGVLVCCVQSRLSRETYRRERVISQQSSVITAERERSERLIRNILPSAVVERLKGSDELIADHFDDVSVLFVDIVGFTSLALTMPPRLVVGLLNDVFSTFDALAAARGVEKIKTIGDAYMAVAGLPEPRPDHVEAIADLALDMRDQLSSVNERAGRALTYRIGVATGPAVAGVIGRTRFAYDLWGHTVNMAARMESHGASGRIHVTAEVRDRLEKTHVLEPRGSISVKGVGAVETWYLEGRAD